jgi:hypothetical protein
MFGPGGFAACSSAEGDRLWATAGVRGRSRAGSGFGRGEFRLGLGGSGVGAIAVLGRWYGVVI